MISATQSSLSLFDQSPSLRSKSTTSSCTISPRSLSKRSKKSQSRISQLRELHEAQSLLHRSLTTLEDPSSLGQSGVDGGNEEKRARAVEMQIDGDSTFSFLRSALKIRKETQEDCQISSDAQNPRTTSHISATGQSQALSTQLQVMQSSNAPLEQAIFECPFFSSRSQSTTHLLLREQLEYLREKVKKNGSGPILEYHQLSQQTRAQVMNILISRLIHFKLPPQTIFLTLALLDRYLEKSARNKQCVPQEFNYFYLMGSVCILLATKYEAGPAGSMTVSFLHDKILRKLFRLKGIVEAEIHALAVLDFRLNYSFFFNFLETQVRLLSHSLMQHKEYQQEYFAKLMHCFFNGTQALLLQALYWPELAQGDPELLSASCLTLCIRHMVKCVTQVKIQVRSFVKKAEGEIASACGIEKTRLERGLKALIDKLSHACSDFPGMDQAQILYEKSLGEAKKMMSSE